jgi:hypothetical protein
MNERPNKELTDDITNGRTTRPAFEPDTRTTQGNAATRTRDFPSDPQTSAHDVSGEQDARMPRRANGDGMQGAGMQGSQGAGMQGSMNGVPGSQAGSRDTSIGDSHTSLLPGDKAEGFSRRWTDIQSTFVDEPQSAVRSADGLVSEVIQELSQRFSQERQGLEHQWSGGGDVSTEDLRMALRHYRDFFQRLLAA